MASRIYILMKGDNPKTTGTGFAVAETTDAEALTRMFEFLVALPDYTKIHSIEVFGSEVYHCK